MVYVKPLIWREFKGWIDELLIIYSYLNHIMCSNKKKSSFGLDMYDNNIVVFIDNVSATN